LENGLLSIKYFDTTRARLVRSGFLKIHVKIAFWTTFEIERFITMSKIEIELIHPPGYWGDLNSAETQMYEEIEKPVIHMALFYDYD
jgi:hypothetical protein